MKNGKGLPPENRRDDPFKSLAAAIVRQAVIDDWQYRKSYQMWSRRALDPASHEARKQATYYSGLLKSMRYFFCSQRFQMLMDADGARIYKALDDAWKEGRKPLIGYREDRI